MKRDNTSEKWSAVTGIGIRNLFRNPLADTVTSLGDGELYGIHQKRSLFFNSFRIIIYHISDDENHCRAQIKHLRERISIIFHTKNTNISLFHLRNESITKPWVTVTGDMKHSPYK